MKILFLWLDIDTGFNHGANHGLAWIAGHLKSLGHEVVCHPITKDGQLESVTKILKDYQPNVVGFSLTSCQRRYLDYYADGLRKNHTGLIICGGIHSILDPADILNCDAVDGVCFGEGEYPLALLGEHLDTKTSYMEVPSFWWKTNKGQDGDYQIVKNPIEPLVEDLSKLTLPDYSVFDLKKLHKALNGFAEIMISRGCPYSCTYCCNDAIKSCYPKDSKYFRILAPDIAVDLLVQYKNNFPEISGFHFDDDLFTWNKKWVKAFCADYTSRIGLPYHCNGKFELIQSEEIIRYLKNSGCKLLRFGLESGNEHYRKTHLKRYHSNEKIFNAARLMHKEGLKFFTFNIFGFPMETKEMMNETITINKKIRPSSGQAYFFYPFVNTELYNYCRDNGLLNVEDMDGVSGYRERPVIKLTHCTEKECISAQQDLLLFFLTRRLSTILGMKHVIFEKIIHWLLMLRPSLFVSILTKENYLKKALRKIQYAYFARGQASTSLPMGNPLESTCSPPTSNSS